MIAAAAAFQSCSMQNCPSACMHAPPYSPPFPGACARRSMPAGLLLLVIQVEAAPTAPRLLQQAQPARAPGRLQGSRHYLQPCPPAPHGSNRHVPSSHATTWLAYPTSSLVNDARQQRTAFPPHAIQGCRCTFACPVSTAQSACNPSIKLEVQLQTWDFTLLDRPETQGGNGSTWIPTCSEAMCNSLNGQPFIGTASVPAGNLQCL